MARKSKSVSEVTKAAHQAAHQLEMELVRFKTGDRSIAFNIDVTAETVWATQQQVADLFERDKSVIAKHIKNVLDDKELDENSVVAKIATTASDGKTYEVSHYNLDMILSVGYRVSSPKATEFRRWATQTLRSYIVDGYALNERRLRDDPQKLSALAARIRELRNDERNIYASVRDCFKDAATDYDSASQQCRTFYATIQDKFLFAITNHTASELVIERADHKQPNMGLQTMAGNLPKVDEVKIGKNYLDRDELYTLHLLCEQFLLFAESKALRGQKMTMTDLSKKLDDLLRVNEYPVLQGYKDYLKDKAVRHATAELGRFSVRLKQNDVKRVSRST